VLPVALVAWALFMLLRQSDGSLSFSGSDTGGVTTRMLGAGAWAWVLGASTLATLGVVDPGRRKPRYA
jgi:hypothetical protein